MVTVLVKDVHPEDVIYEITNKLVGFIFLFISYVLHLLSFI